MALAVARLLLAPALLALAAWFALQRYRRPDLLTRWLAAKVVVLLVAIALAGIATAAGDPTVALVGVVLADAVAYFLAVRLWVERRPVRLSDEDAAREAARLAHAALDVANAAERNRGPRA